MLKYYLTAALVVLSIANQARAETATVVTKDGVAVADSDGNVVAVGNDGSVHAEDEDGNKVTVGADGSTRIEDEDGNVVHQDSDGNVTVVEAE